ncbi:PREDICTED: uncharacterized protein LOC104746279 [Camelina sativa]|uniref:Uncharacterized protein LOC104746279 n=1 Tax=Camelina sativa TaxID=90675 RepID=A0ABM0W5N1_CAMSA|nr:PREDICTED: uncharacterized protein LOC104746279 [Camelina sativa]
MGTFLGYFVPGLSLAILGLWHIINTIQSYSLNFPNPNFTSRFWFPFPYYNKKLRHLELIFIMIVSFLSIYLLNPYFPSFKLSSFKPKINHVLMFFQLVMFAFSTLIFDFLNPSDEDSGFIGVHATLVFMQEVLFLLDSHSTDHLVLESQYYFLLELAAFVSFFSALVSTLYPKSFYASIVFSVSVMFQGCWFLNMGMEFMLLVPNHVHRGCVTYTSSNNSIGLDHSALVYESPCTEIMAQALANLEFSWILSAILIFTCVLCLKISGESRRVAQLPVVIVRV